MAEAYLSITLDVDDWVSGGVLSACTFYPATVTAPGGPFAVLGEFVEITSGQAIQPAPFPTSPNTTNGLTRLATDGERLGRLGWMPGAKQ